MSNSAAHLWTLDQRTWIPLGVGIAAGFAASLVGRISSVFLVLLIILAIAAILMVRIWPLLAVVVVCGVRAAAEGLNGLTASGAEGAGIDPVDALNGAFLIGGAWWLFANRRRIELKRLPLALPALAFGLIASLSLLRSSGYVLGAKDLSKLASAFVPLLIIVALRPDRSWRKKILAAIVGSAVIPLAVGALQFVQDQGINFEARGGLRVQSVFAHPNTFALYLLTVAVAAWGLYPEVSGGARRAVVSIGLASVVAQVLPMSRSAWIAVAIVLLALSLRHPRLLAWAAGGASLALLFMPRLLDRALNLLAEEEGAAALGTALTGSSVDIRLDFWSAGIELWKGNPIFGLGWGSFEFLTGGGFTHNDYLRVLVELGIVGLLVFLWFGGALLVRAVRARNDSELNLAFMGLSVAYLLVAFVTNTFEKTPYQWYFWVLAGLALLSSEEARTRSSPRRGT